MAILSDEHKEKVKEMFDAQLKGPVEALLFHVDADDYTTQYTDAMREIVTELAALSEGRITLREMSMEGSKAEAEQYRIEEVPSVVLLGEGGKDTGIRFYGATLGYEFMVLLEDLVDVSRGETRLAEATRQQLQGITEEQTVLVFTTPT